MKFYCFRARLHCYYCLYNIFSANTVRRSEELRGSPSIWDFPPLLEKVSSKMADKRELMRWISDNIYGNTSDHRITCIIGHTLSIFPSLFLSRNSVKCSLSVLTQSGSSVSLSFSFSGYRSPEFGRSSCHVREVSNQRCRQENTKLVHISYPDVFCVLCSSNVASRFCCHEKFSQSLFLF